MERSTRSLPSILHIPLSKAVNTSSSSRRYIDNLEKDIEEVKSKRIAEISEIIKPLIQDRISLELKDNSNVDELKIQNDVIREQGYTIEWNKLWNDHRVIVNKIYAEHASVSIHSINMTFVNTLKLSANQMDAIFILINSNK